MHDILQTSSVTYRSLTEKLTDFTAAHITGVNIQFVPGDDLKKIFNGMSFNPVPSRASVRAVLRAEKAGETTVDLSKKPNEGGGSGGEDDRPGEL